MNINHILYHKLSGRALFSILLYLSLTTVVYGQRLTQYVNPFIGTDAHGHTFPGATYPFGMMQLSPDTRLTGWDGCAGYHYSDSLIYGFSHTHLSGTGVADYCDILIMPVSGFSMNKEFSNSEYSSPFTHQNEHASPGYYDVYLSKFDIFAQLTVGKRSGMHRYEFGHLSASEKRSVKNGAQIVIDLTHRDILLSSEIKISGNSSIEGFRRSKSWTTDQIIYYYIEFSKPFSSIKLFGNNKAIVNFENNKELLLRIGISSVSTENAKMNLRSEISDWNFDALKESADSAWNSYLSKIEIDQNADKDWKTVFYTALYHTAIAPNLYSDVNGEYRGIDREVHKADGYDQYSVFSLWDTYRALHPLFTIIERNRSVDFIKSFMAIFQQGGKLPIWELSGNETDCMIGYHAIPVIADAYMKGITGFEIEPAFRAMIASSERDDYGADKYRKYGFIPSEMEHESVSKTLEYSYDDWCIAQIAKDLKNKCDKKVCRGYCAIYNKLIKRAQYYKNLFDPESGFMRPKYNGNWLSPFDPREVSVHYTEANSWQYSLYVPQDIETHIEMMGGDDAYVSKLDALFSASEKTIGRSQVDITGLIGQYAHGNEPSHHAAYLYSYAGKPWRTQEMTRKIMTELYTPYPDGLCGNDDCGQMSAWLVMSSLGFYPVTPADTIFTLGSPLFREATINLENGKRFSITAPNNSSTNKYIKGISINGVTTQRSFLSYKEILLGGSLAVDMDSIPNKDFGRDPHDRPRSKITEGLIVINPTVHIDNPAFRDSTTVSITTAYKDSSHIAFYSLDTTNHEFIEYKEPIVIKKSSAIYAYVLDKKSGKKSAIISGEIRKIESDWTIQISSKYNPQYSAGGESGLIDGIRGAKNYRLGGWQGYQSTDFEAIVDLGAEKSIQKIGAGFLQDIRSWIWMPQYMEIYASKDGEEYIKIANIKHSVSDKDSELQIIDLTEELSGVPARYIKIFAKSYGNIPEWHPGAGSAAFIFIDEILIECR